MKQKSWSISPSPFLFTRPTVFAVVTIQLISLIPVLVVMGIEHNYKSFLIILIAFMANYISDLFLNSFKISKGIIIEQILLESILIGLFLPQSISVVIVFYSVFFACFFSKYLYGGNGTNWISPVATSILIIYINAPTFFSSSLLSIENLQSIGSFFEAIKLEGFTILNIDSSLTQKFNNSLFAKLGTRLPEGYISLLWASPSLIPAVRYNFLILVSSIFLLATKAINWFISFIFILTYACCIYIFSGVPYGLPFLSGDVIFSFLTTGVFFVAFYILPHYSLFPKTITGKIIASFCAGFIAFIFTGPGDLPIGTIFSVLCISLINVVIEYIENVLYKKRI